MPPAIVLRLYSATTKKTNSGLTLIELMVTITIVALMAAFAAPNLMLFVRTATVRGATTELAAALNYARSESVKRGWPVTVCKASTINANTPSCSTSATWQDGWLTFVDNDRDGTIDSGDIVLRVGAPPSSKVEISSSGSNFANRVSYLPTGISNTNGCLELTLSGIKRGIVISNSGRLRIDIEGCA